MAYQQNEGQRPDKSFENMAKFKYMRVI